MGRITQVFAPTAASYLSSGFSGDSETTVQNGSHVAANAASGGNVLAGFDWNAPVQWRPFFAFDTSSLPDNAVIISVDLSYIITSVGPGGATNYVNAYFYDYGAAVDATDWLNIAALAAAGADCYNNDSRMVTNQRFRLLSKAQALTKINLTGLTKLFVDNGYYFAGGSSNSHTQNMPTAQVQLSVTYELPQTRTPGRGKRFKYQIYDKSGNYLGKWLDTEVLGDPEIAQEANSGGSEVVVKLARQTNQLTSEIDFDNRVVITVFDEDVPSGKSLFTGRISKYKEVYDQDDYIEITLIGYGAELAEYILEALKNIVVAYGTFPDNGIYVSNNIGTPMSVAAGGAVAMKFVATTTNIQKIRLFSTGSIGNTLAIYADDGTGKPGVQLFSAPTTTIGYDPGVAHFYYGCEINPFLALTVGTTYHIVNKDFTGTGSIATFLPNTGGAFTSSDNGVTWVSSANSIMYELFAGTRDTTVAYNDDITFIFKDLVDRYRLAGGTLNYLSTGLDLTGVTVNYNFKVSSVFDALQTLISVSPVGWYWGIDQANNTIYLKYRENNPTHILKLGQHILKIEPERSEENIINTVLFTGGEVSPGVNFYKRYVDTALVAKYGVRAIQMVDNRVTLEATADLMVARKMSINNVPAMTITVEILDTQSAATSDTVPLGVDLESIAPAHMVAIRTNENNPGGLSLWDVAYWDQAYWDFNLRDLNTMNLEITRYEYAPDKATLTLSSLPSDISKTVDQVSRQLDDIVTQNNPGTPTGA